jgi:hypothetical protein
MSYIPTLELRESAPLITSLMRIHQPCAGFKAVPMILGPKQSWH